MTVYLSAGLLQVLIHFPDFFFEDFIYLFLDRREGREKEEKHQCVVTPQAVPPHTLVTWPATQACALTGNQTGDPLVHRPALSLLSHTSQGQK